MNRAPVQSVAAVLDAVLAGAMSPSDAVNAIEALPRELWDAILDDAYHRLIHYREDEDIRERDSGYAAGQRRPLAKLAARLRSAGNNAVVSVLP